MLLCNPLIDWMALTLDIYKKKVLLMLYMIGSIKLITIASLLKL